MLIKSEQKNRSVLLTCFILVCLLHLCSKRDFILHEKLSALSRGEGGGGVGACKKAKVGVLNAALKFCFGCFFQLQNRLQSRLQHKGMSMHHFLQPSRGEWGARRGSSPGYLSAGVTRITVKP